ncbi:MAG TPA: GDP-mannose 4,6-dehydratase [Fibrobacteria bacterium]|nr:GDP-mannose 4,6-dehydratase [Fibrobacteria bacterium]HOX53118.1 GDP-mannose 4,6-dehydratase [Fibrobacteria bacterium]
MSILVAGTTGAVAHHLIESLPRELGPLIAAGLEPPPTHQARRDVHYVRTDLRDPEEAQRLMEYHQPTQVYHLAAQMSVRAGENEPEESLLGNVSIARNVLEACRRHCPGARILLQSSSEVYGRGPSGRGAEVPRTESDPLSPLSTTGASLACAEILAGQYALGHGLRILVTRPFNVVGPGLSQRLLAGEIAWQLARIRLDKGEPIVYAGDLEVKRDYLDVRDLARAYLLLMEKGEVGQTYNICTGKAVSARQVAELLLQFHGGNVELRFDPRRERTTEIPIMVGSPEKLTSATGWLPAISLRESLRDLWNDMLQRHALERKGTIC